MFDVIVDGVSMVRSGFLPQKRPDESTPNRKIQKTTVLMNDGDSYRSLPFFEDKKQSVEFNFMAERPELFNEKLRKFRKLVMNAKCMIFSDDRNYFRKIKTLTINECTRSTQTLGRVSVDFILDPYQYYVPGAQFYADSKIYSFNSHDLSYPIYQIKGGGQVTLTVNGYSCKVTIPNVIYLDTKKEIAYDENKGNRNSSTNADYSKLVLKPGKNSITLSVGELEVMPNWRDL